MPDEKSCGAVVFRKVGRQRLYLLLHYEEGHWDFPKGHVEPGEGEADTARRETMEETGISDIEFVFGFREPIEYFYKREGKTMHKSVFFFLTETKTTEVKLSSEHVGYEWLPYGKALERLTFKNAKEVLAKAEKFIAAAAPGA